MNSQKDTQLNSVKEKSTSEVNSPDRLHFITESKSSPHSSLEASYRWKSPPKPARPVQLELLKVRAS